MNPHWARFLQEIPWFLSSDETAEAGDTEPPGAWAPKASAFTEEFPKLAEILSTAYVTPVSPTRGTFVLYSWPREADHTYAWLSPPPATGDVSALYPKHQLLLTSFGGIVERTGERRWWLLNHNDALTEREARWDATFIRDAASRFENGVDGIPIELEQFYSIAREANGNNTLCHRVTGEVVLFAQDHAYKHVEVYPGCPPYTLYRLRGAPDFSTWVDTISSQWLETIGDAG